MQKGHGPWEPWSCELPRPAPLFLDFSGPEPTVAFQMPPGPHVRCVDAATARPAIWNSTWPTYMLQWASPPRDVPSAQGSSRHANTSTRTCCRRTGCVDDRICNSFKNRNLPGAGSRQLQPNYTTIFHFIQKTERRKSQTELVQKNNKNNNNNNNTLLVWIVFWIWNILTAWWIELVLLPDRRRTHILFLILLYSLYIFNNYTSKNSFAKARKIIEHIYYQNKKLNNIFKKYLAILYVDRKQRLLKMLTIYKKKKKVDNRYF